jgi:hypothetical protein
MRRWLRLTTVFYLGVHQNVHQFSLHLFFTLGLPNNSPARGPSRSQNLAKSFPLPGSPILPGTREGFGREAENGPSRYAPGHDADGGPHPNRFEPRGVFLDMAVERSRWACPRLTCHLVFGVAEDGIHRN